VSAVPFFAWPPLWHAQAEGASRVRLSVKNDLTLSEEDVARFCRETLTDHKPPKYIEFRDELPKTNVGKILRRELRTAKH